MIIIETNEPYLKKEVTAKKFSIRSFSRSNLAINDQTSLYNKNLKTIEKNSKIKEITIKKNGL
jgi:hypothetical protein